MSKSFRAYMGVPFVDGGRDLVGFDCWGLIYTVYRHELDIMLPTYGEISCDQLISVAKEIHKETNAGGVWRRLDELELPVMYDVAVMSPLARPGGRPDHVGLVTDHPTILHTEASAESHLINVEHRLIAGRLIGFYRHREMDDDLGDYH